MTMITHEQGTISVRSSLFVRIQEQDRVFFSSLSPEDCAQIEQIFVRNLASGRAQRVMGRLQGQRSETDDAAGFACTTQTGRELEPWQLCYLQRLAQVYRQEHLRLKRLVQGDHDTWQALAAQLVNSAHRLLLHKGICADLAREMARDAAQQTCINIYSSVFPYDVAFNAWIHVILKNQILYTLTRSGDLLDRHYIDSLDQLQIEGEDHYLWVIAGYTAATPYPTHWPNPGQIEDRDWLVRALAKVSNPERRAVIIFTYFYELSDEEIALQLGKSKGAIYTLRHRALKQLQQVLSDSSDP